jgi:phosphoribosylaminoimidazole (AIR) synthetase
MLRTFNMGWGFAVVVDKSVSDETLDVLERSGESAERIGEVTRSGGIVAFYKDQKLVLR